MDQSVEGRYVLTSGYLPRTVENLDESVEGCSGWGEVSLKVMETLRNAS